MIMTNKIILYLKRYALKFTIILFRFKYSTV